MPIRAHLLGNPHTYVVTARTAFNHPIFSDAAESAAFFGHLELVRRAFDCRLFAFALLPSAFHLIVQHQSSLPIGDALLQQRWGLIHRKAVSKVNQLKARFTSLSGFMQTLMQRISRDWNERHQARGSIWAHRFRACLLADDTATLAATTWLVHHFAGQASAIVSRSDHAAAAMVTLAAPPLRVGPDDQLLPADEATLAMSPPAESDVAGLLLRFGRSLRAEAIAAYGAAIQRGWALGRPESLTDILTRIGRGPGRGRSRSLRDLADDLGLCGVWG